jgi:hypothetical protein
MGILNVNSLLAELAYYLPKYEDRVNCSVLFSETPKAAHYYYEKGGETQRLHVNRGIASNLNSEVLNYEEFPKSAGMKPPGASMPFGGWQKYLSLFVTELLLTLEGCGSHSGVVP